MRGANGNYLSGVKRNGRFGFIDKKGNEVIPIKYDGVEDFFEDLAVVKLNDKWGCINKENEVIIPFKYNDISNFKNGLAAAIIHGKNGLFGKVYHGRGYIDKNGTEYWED